MPCQIAQCAWRAIITYFWQPLISKRIIWIIWIHWKNDNCPLFTELSWIKDLFDSCFPSNEISNSWPLSWTYIPYHRSNSSYSVQLTDLFSAAFQRYHIFHPIASTGWIQSALLTCCHGFRSQKWVILQKYSISTSGFTWIMIQSTILKDIQIVNFHILVNNKKKIR